MLKTKGVAPAKAIHTPLKAKSEASKLVRRHISQQRPAAFSFLNIQVVYSYIKTHYPVFFHTVKYLERYLDQKSTAPLPSRAFNTKDNGLYFGLNNG